MGLIAMSERDLQRIEVLSKVIDGRKPGRRTDFMNDPKVVARREKALMRQPAAE